MWMPGMCLVDKVSIDEVFLEKIFIGEVSGNQGDTLKILQYGTA